ncbi:MAG: type IV secretion system protein, partial [Janthinobacterium lividum]
MIAGCAAASTAPVLARDILAGADCLISGQIEQGYSALLAPGGGFSEALTLGLTIYVAIIGYRLILGQAGLSLGEVVPHFVKIGLVVALATSWPAYQSLVFNVLFHGPEQLAAPILRQVGGAGTSGDDVLAALQGVFDRMTDYAGDAWAQHAPRAVAAA